MKKRTFANGVHPPDAKEHTHERPITALPAGKTLVVPLSQHTGAPAEPLVRKGERVLFGQKIAEARGLISSAVHAPAAGTVSAVEHRLSPLGVPVAAVVIENDGSEERHPTAVPLHADPADYSPAEVLAAAREGGIVGLGGAAFPTAVKLAPPREYAVDTLLVNAAECEPWLACDYRLLLEKTAEIVAAAGIVARTVGARRVWFGIETNKPQALQAVESALKGRGEMQVAALATKYPQGGEKMLVKAVLGREVPAGGLPFHVGVVVQNVGTLHALWRMLAEGTPLVERVLTVAGDAVPAPANYSVRIGTSFREVLAAAGAPEEGEYSLLMGGPMMGIAQWTRDVPVVKAASGILLLRGNGRPLREYPCIRCNRCVGHCPMKLVPTRLAALIRVGDIATAREWGLADCMECGSCAYLCPAAIPLVHWLRFGKAEAHRLKRQSEMKP